MRLIGREPARRNQAGLHLAGRRVAALAAVAVVLTGTTPASASTTAAADLPGLGGYGPGDAGWVNYYSSPADTGTWNAFCADAGASEVTVPGIAVPACGPVGGTAIDIPYAYPYAKGGETYTPGFQCVELTDRYLYATRHWGAVGGDGADVVRVYGAAHAITPVQSGTPGEAPQPGDVISFSVEQDFTDDGDFYPGHTAIVSAASVGPAGNGSVTILSENFSGTAETTRLGVSDWTVQPIESSDADGGLVNTPYVEWLPLTRPGAGSGAAAGSGSAAVSHQSAADPWTASHAPLAGTAATRPAATRAAATRPAATQYAGRPRTGPDSGPAANPGPGLLAGLASTASPAITGLSGGAWQVAYPTA
jgi:CHAP domain